MPIGNCFISIMWDHWFKGLKLLREIGKVSRAKFNPPEFGLVQVHLVHHRLYFEDQMLIPGQSA